MREEVKIFLSNYVDAFKVLNVEIHSLILFGSQARGTATISSDIDIAVVSKNALASFVRGQLRCLGDDINPMLDVNLFFTTPEALENADEELDTNKYIKEEGVELWPSYHI